MTNINNWIKEFKGAVTVCDKKGIILQMNNKAIATFEKYGGADLIGKRLINCHPKPSRSRLEEMLLTEKSNSYTIEKNGVKKLIYQSPWYEDQKYMGFVEYPLIAYLI